MPLPASVVERERLHVRRVTYSGYRRKDGLLDIEAHILDNKDQEYALSSGKREAREDLHNISVRVTVNRDMVIQDVLATHDAQPYPGHCETITEDYKKIIGLSLFDHFRLHLNEKMGGIKGCTHLTELLAWLPSAAMQTIAGERKDFEPQSTKKPIQLDRCHALVSTGETVRKYYPKWFIPAAQE